MDDRILQAIEREYGGDCRIRIVYEDDNLVLFTFTKYFGDLVRAVPKAKDKIDVLWIYGGFYALKLEGDDLATIWGQLVSVPRGFMPYSDKIILGSDMLYRYGILFFISCSNKAFYLPKVKITEYKIPDFEFPDEDMDDLSNDN